ncbi:hypothetical protein Bbelb_350950 [Branchiostoma belcheri]|nr:hypothetical protein Bbelb_350950 [Branchiostoma belcheri]
MKKVPANSNGSSSEINWVKRETEQAPDGSLTVTGRQVDQTFVNFNQKPSQRRPEHNQARTGSHFPFKIWTDKVRGTHLNLEGNTERPIPVEMLRTFASDCAKLKKQVQDLTDLRQKQSTDAAKFQVIDEARIPPPLFSAARIISALTYLEERARKSNHAEMVTFWATLNEAYGHHSLLGMMILHALGPKEDEDIEKMVSAVAAHPLGPRFKPLRQARSVVLVLRSVVELTIFH